MSDNHRHRFISKFTESFSDTFFPLVGKLIAWYILYKIWMYFELFPVVPVRMLFKILSYYLETGMSHQ